jgi:hypothetical protein
MLQVIHEARFQIPRVLRKAVNAFRAVLHQRLGHLFHQQNAPHRVAEPAYFELLDEVRRTPPAQALMKEPLVDLALEMRQQHRDARDRMREPIGLTRPRIGIRGKRLALLLPHHPQLPHLIVADLSRVVRAHSH